MEQFFDPRLLWLFLAGLPVGVFAIFLGGTMFLSVPIFQLLFPGLPLGAIIGNIKVGSVFRDAAALHPVRKHVPYKILIPIAIIFVMGGVAGAIISSSMKQVYVLPIIILAVVIMEAAPFFSKHLSSKAYLLIALLAAVYGGMFGAGIFIIILAIIRLKITEDDQILQVRAGAVFIELLMQIASVIVFAMRGQLILPIWVVWASGSILGGYLGGWLLGKTGKLPSSIQKILLRAVFLFAILTVCYRLFWG